MFHPNSYKLRNNGYGVFRYNMLIQVNVLE